MSVDTAIPIVVHPVETDWYEPTSAYVELFWLPTVGPTATWLYRRLASVTVEARGPVAFDVADLAAQLGVRPGAIRHTLERLVRFGLAYQWSAVTFGVPSTAPRLMSHHVSHLPASLQEAHARHLEREAVTA